MSVTPNVRGDGTVPVVLTPTSAPPPPPPAAAPTERLAERLGPYRLVQRLGEGGMGVVHLALDPHGRAVAIKVLRPGIAHDEDARARLEREVDTLSRVRHPRVAPVIDADLYGPRPYVVTRYVAGDPLDDAVATRGPLAGAELVRLARGLLGALEAIHAVGVVHRDLKPGNVLLDDDGEPVVIDFGIAHVADDARLTSTGMVMGTPGYLAPEIIEGAAVTPATDWWGWAATLAFAATGRPPFGRGSMDIVLTRVRAGSCDLSGVDPRLEPLLAAALSPDPLRRPSVAAVMAGLERYAAGGFAADLLAGPAPVPPQTGYAAPRHTLVMPLSPAPPPAPAHPAIGYAAAPVAPVAPVAPAPAGGTAAPAGVGDPGGAWGPEDTGQWGSGGGADRRIGRPDRTGTLVALGAAAAGLATVAPVVALLVLAGWAWMARAVDRSMTSLVMRRYDNGLRRSDIPVAVALGPVHVLGAAVSAALGLLLPVIVGVAAVLCVVLGLTVTGAAPPGVSQPLGLGAGAVVGMLMAWWGPGGASLRRGSKSIVRGLVPAGLATEIVVGVLVVAALAGVGWCVARGGVTLWAPLSEAPAPLSWR